MIRKSIDNFNLQQIADSGQCFRMKMADDDHAVIIAQGRILEIRRLPGVRQYDSSESVSSQYDSSESVSSQYDSSKSVSSQYDHSESGGEFEFDCSEDEFDMIWENYFDLNTDYGKFIRAIPSDDLFLSKAASYGSGIRILNQDAFETLITFIISQRKNIPAIKASVEKLCYICGEEISEGVFAFPSPKALAELSAEDLKRCSLGYRAEYVHRAAEAVWHGDVDLAGLCKLSDSELFDSLCSFYGVGKKVANCVGLFAYHRIDLFPIDVWIQRVIDEQYGGHVPTERYSGFAGVIQQYMFYYGRTL